MDSRYRRAECEQGERKEERSGKRRSVERGEVWKGEKEREDEIESEGNEERFIV